MNIRIKKKFSKREGRDVYILDYYGPDRRRYRERAGTTPKAADLAKARLIARIDRGEWHKIKPMKFSEFLNKHYKPEHLDLRVKDPYKAKSVLKPVEASFGSMLVTQIGVRQVEAYQRERIKAGLNAATVNREVGRLRHAMNWAIDRGYAVSQPVGKRMMLREGGGRHPEILSPVQFGKLVLSLPSHLRPVALCAYHTGMRRGEILALTWDRVDLRGGFLTLTETKSGEDRTVPIPGPLDPELRRLRAEGLGKGLDVKNGTVFMVPAPKGKGHRPEAQGKAVRKPRPIGQFSKSWEKACEAAGLPEFRFHDLRHNFVSRALAAGVPPHHVRAISGHKTDSMLRRYSHVTPDGLKAAMNRLRQADVRCSPTQRQAGTVERQEAHRSDGD